MQSKYSPADSSQIFLLANLYSISWNNSLMFIRCIFPLRWKFRTSDLEQLWRSLAFLCLSKGCQKKKERNYISGNSARAALPVFHKYQKAVIMQHTIWKSHSLHPFFWNCINGLAVYTQFRNGTRKRTYRRPTHTNRTFLISRIIYNLKAIDELGNKLSVFSLLLPACWWAALLNS